MISLLKKELNTFLGSITGYLVISIFLLTSSLFLWVFPGNYNIIDGQRATLKGFFDLSPWLYLFLIPAITMRMFSEEKRMGTIEMLITRPITSLNIVLAKYLASLILVIISLIPTLLYFFSVYKLGNPVGNIDTGATWGSFIGLVFLASVYVSIGLFSSILTSNQVVSFLIAIALSYIFYLGFSFLSDLGFQNLIPELGIYKHYVSISRGVVDSRDLFYFLFCSVIFIALTQHMVQKQTQKIKSIKNISIFFVFLFIAYGAISQRLFRIDLTSENRYSLSPATKELLNKQDQVYNFEIYLSGNLPAGMKEFQDAIIETIEDLNAYSSKRIQYEIIDVYKINNEENRNEIIRHLISSGIQPVNFGHKTTEGLSTKQIFPGVIVKNKTKAIAINLLKNNPILSPDENLQQSIELLEYEFTSALRYLQQTIKPRIAFLQKEGLATQYETGAIRYALNENYEIVDRTPNELLVDDSLQTLIIAAPTMPFTEKEKLQIDQFIMNGGKVLWCFDPVEVSIDSLSRGLQTIAFEKGLNIRDQLFIYGARINSDLLQDAFCLEYPVNTAPSGQATNFTPAPFYYAPLALPNPNHSLSRNLNNVKLEFASSISLVGEKNDGTKILATSPYGRSIQTPVEVSLMSATNPPDAQLFNKPNIPIGVLLEGKFESAFKNRMTAQLGFSNIRTSSEPSKMIVITDGDIIVNKVQNKNGKIQIQQLGFDKYSGQTFGNLDFLVNCVDYLSNDTRIMQIRSRIVKLRMLDKVKIRDQKLKWQLINVLLPILIFIIFGVVFVIIRKRRFTGN